MMPFSVILDGTVGPVTYDPRRIVCSVGARILLLDPVSLERCDEVALPPQGRLLQLAVAGDQLFALLKNGTVVRRTLANGEHWCPVAGEAALDLAGIDGRIFVLVRTRVVEIDPRLPDSAITAWSVPASAERLASAGRYLVALGPGTVWIGRVDGDGHGWTVESMQHPLAASGREDTVLVADHLAGLYRLRVCDRIIEGPIPNVLHPRAVAFDGNGWLVATEDGLAAAGSIPEIGFDNVMDLRTTKQGVCVVQPRRVSLVREGRIAAVAEFPGYAFQSVHCGETVACATQGGLLLCSDHGVARLPLPEYPMAVALTAPWLFAASTRCLYAIDLSCLDSPEVRFSFPRCGEPVTLAADPVRQRLVWGCGRTVSTLDVREPSRPIMIATHAIGVYPRALAVAGARTYAATGPGGLLAADIGNELKPVDGTGYAMDVAANGERAIVAAVKALVVYASNVGTPHLTERVDVCACDLSGRRVLVAAGEDLLSYNLSVSQFELVGSGHLPFAPRRVRVCAGAALVSGVGGVILARPPSRGEA